MTKLQKEILEAMVGVFNVGEKAKLDEVAEIMDAPVARVRGTLPGMYRAGLLQKEDGGISLTEVGVKAIAKVEKEAVGDEKVAE